MSSHRGPRFLIDPGTWDAEGTYVLPGARRVPAWGTTQVEHRSGLWVVRGVLTIELGDDTRSFESVSRVQPPGPESLMVLPWESDNPDLGQLQGQYVIQDRVVISTWRAVAGGATGVETINRQNDGSYYLGGMAVVGGEVRSGWELRLVSEDR